eukprot:9503789-Pyramimonas_sp.AAC.4
MVYGSEVCLVPVRVIDTRLESIFACALHAVWFGVAGTAMSADTKASMRMCFVMSPMKLHALAAAASEFPYAAPTHAQLRPCVGFAAAVGGMKLACVLTTPAGVLGRPTCSIARADKVLRPWRLAGCVALRLAPSAKVTRAPAFFLPGMSIISKCTEMVYNDACFR